MKIIEVLILFLQKHELYMSQDKKGLTKLNL